MLNMPYALHVIESDIISFIIHKHQPIFVIIFVRLWSFKFYPRVKSDLCTIIMLLYCSLFVPVLFVSVRFILHMLFITVYDSFLST
jgi:hypothetical protein